ncbi:hypothetical protein F4859DRAFT_510104 [Xylaria cf. heliscus]|nr:hypothetical protein F4859DRAFT_510104 [Xylaria cf. heliscus]
MHGRIDNNCFNHVHFSIRYLDTILATMTKSWVKLLSIPALIAEVAQGLLFTNDIPVGHYYDVGTEFVLEWAPETRTDTFNLTVFSILVDPIIVSPNGGPLGGAIYDFKPQTVVLDDAVKFTDQSYTWVITPIDGRTGADWWYSFDASWGYESTSPRAFHLAASS